eukprot:CAMPEP_0183714154 /NCGR_PEP_ID=MMETSP0737-20130205/8790_1 /TAXON_ID=385413 /ORGANISM="Thalassiosira miniscula, Strain CCMP1093" /LENGTH=1265 /DNA_ID=CAMNT_0025943059 /DNA_START=110 /DNA_END=3907 /DNA_ORIENTATION=+
MVRISELFGSCIGRRASATATNDDFESNYVTPVWDEKVRSVPRTKSKLDAPASKAIRHDGSSRLRSQSAQTISEGSSKGSASNVADADDQTGKGAEESVLLKLKSSEIPTDPIIGTTVTRANAAESRSTTSAPISGTGQCPFRHGTVYARPYPGYAHGNPNKGICPKGCRPEMNCDITETETVKQTLLREAKEFIDLYYHEREEEMKGHAGFQSKEERIKSIEESIESTETYEHTYDEIQHGARVAWRNAPKCSNRKYWQNLKLIDCRDAQTNKEMYACCLQHLAKAMACGSAEAYISVFRPAAPGTDSGPRIWNDQLLSYAAYSNKGDVTGDPKNLRFTQMLEERFGWSGPPDEKKGTHDYLPLVIQADPQGPPEMFELPLNCAPPVHIFHPKYPELSELNMKWYPTPAVCALDLTLGGILYTAVPFNGWYADTEVLRDLIDEDRYNLMVPIAKALGLNTELKAGEPPYYKEEVSWILCKAIYHSFKTAKVAMIDHHTLIDMFWVWYNNEMVSRKYCPVNWKWVIPPMSSHTNGAYLGLSKAQEYTLKPAYLVGKGYVQLEKEAFGERNLDKPFRNLFVAMIFGIYMKRWLAEIRARKPAVLIIYASVTGNAQCHAADLGSILSKAYSVTFFDACGPNAATDTDVMGRVQASKLVIFVSSTQGNGVIPSLSEKFFSSLFGDNSQLIKGKECAVLGFGSSSYPIFCGGAVFISNMLARCGATELVARGECDAVRGEDKTFRVWIRSLVVAMASKESASCMEAALLESIQDDNNSIVGKRRQVLDSLEVQVFSQEDTKKAAASLFVANRSNRAIATGTGRGKTTTMNELSKKQSLMTIILSSSVANPEDNEDGNRNIFTGIVKSREEMIRGIGEEEKERGTSLIKIDLSHGNPPYEPGDHVRIFPQNLICQDQLDVFIGKLKKNHTRHLTLDDEIYAKLTNNDLKADLKVHLPLLDSIIDCLVPLRRLFKEDLAISAPISMEACVDLTQIASEAREQVILKKLGTDDDEYEKWINMCGLKWIDLFEHFPSLSNKVSIEFLLCMMMKNHARSYSIASCKSVVGPELHLIVGRFVYSRGSGDDKKTEVGVCSSYLTSTEPGEEVLLEIESMRQFHLPSDPSSPIFLICTGTGYAPIRGLLQGRAHLLQRGEELGPAYLIFGSRSYKEALFHDEIREFSEKGALDGVFFCYSRQPGMKKEYTPDKLRSAEVKTVLNLFLRQANSHVFMCGSANMAEGCKKALKDILPHDCFDSASKDGRIHCDVFGALA